MIDFIITINVTAASTTSQRQQVFERLEAIGVPKVTCFVQMDNAVEEAFGDGCALFRRLPQTNMTVERGWLARPGDGRMWEWYHKYGDIRTTKVVRIAGEVDNDSIRAVDEMHFDVDSSAVGGTENWRETGNTPYRPFREDRRVGGTPNRRLWEVPQTSIPIPSPSDSVLTRRPIDLFTRPEILHPAFAEVADKLTVCVSSVWCENLGESPDELYSNRLEDLESNVAFMRECYQGVHYNVISQCY